MILLLGASGYLGRGFSSELHRRGIDFVPLTRRVLDYTDFNQLFNYLRKARPEFVINAAGHAGRVGGKSGERERAAMLIANTILPQTIAKACLMTKTSWGHISSAGIYSGAKIAEDDGIVVERDFSQPEILRLLAEQPEKIHGYTEKDEPNYSFRQSPCSFHSGTKALAEEAIRGVGRGYIWRLGTPFNEQDESRNFLSRLQHHSRVLDDVLALSHTNDFVQACLELWESRAPFGVYNVTNPGLITMRQVVELIKCLIGSNNQLEFWQDAPEEQHDEIQKTDAHCLLNTAKLLAAGVKIRTVSEALEEALHHWRTSVSFALPVRTAA
jgi:dTDP-4-dehydrorhamnose reductase